MLFRLGKDWERAMEATVPHINLDVTLVIVSRTNGCATESRTVRTTQMKQLVNVTWTSSNVQMEGLCVDCQSHKVATQANVRKTPGKQMNIKVLISACFKFAL